MWIFTSINTITRNESSRWNFKQMTLCWTEVNYVIKTPHRFPLLRVELIGEFLMVER